MKPGPIAAFVLAIAAVIGVTFVFLTNASPYVTVAQAKEASGENLHLAGVVDQSSIIVDSVNRTTSFTITDDEGDSVEVFHDSIPAGNIANAERVVAVGGVQDGTFVADRLILKCPSKYEADPAMGGTGSYEESSDSASTVEQVSR